jgi:hypothetical protein
MNEAIISLWEEDECVQVSDFKVFQGKVTIMTTHINCLWWWKFNYIP